MSYEVNRKWYSSFDKKTQADEIQEMKNLVFEARKVLEKLEDILSSKKKASFDSMKNLSNYEAAAWSEKMADQLGYQRALDEVSSIIKITNQEK